MKSKENRVFRYCQWKILQKLCLNFHQKLQDTLTLVCYTVRKVCLLSQGDDRTSILTDECCENDLGRNYWLPPGFFPFDRNSSTNTDAVPIPDAESVSECSGTDEDPFPEHLNANTEFIPQSSNPVADTMS